MPPQSRHERKEKSRAALSSNLAEHARWLFVRDTDCLAAVPVASRCLRR